VTGSEEETFSLNAFNKEEDTKKQLNDETGDGKAAASSAEVRICVFIHLYSFFLICC
jgi:hypothetical protein